MFKLNHEAALRGAFRPIDRRHVEITRDVVLPAVVKDYFTWTFGRRVFLVFAPLGEAPRGIVFEADAGEPLVPHMCNWCQQVGLGARVGLLTARRDRTRTVGVLVCSDLGCRDRLEYVANRAGVDVEPSMITLLDRMNRFADGLGFGG